MVGKTTAGRIFCDRFGFSLSLVERAGERAGVNSNFILIPMMHYSR